MKVSNYQYAQVLFKNTYGKDDKSIDIFIENFIKHLKRTRSSNRISRITEMYRKIYNKETKSIKVEVEAKQEPSEKHIKLLIDKISKQKGTKNEIQINFKKNEKISYGMKAMYEDVLIDLTINNKLQALGKQLQ